MDTRLVHLPIENYSKEYPSDMIFIPEKLPRDIFFNGEKWTIRKGEGYMKNNYLLKTEDGQNVYLLKVNREFSCFAYEILGGRFVNRGLSNYSRFYTFVMFQKAEEFLNKKAIENLETGEIRVLSMKDKKEFMKVVWAQRVVKDYRRRLGKEISL